MAHQHTFQVLPRRLHKGTLKGEQVTTPQGFIWTVELPDEEPQQDNHRDDCADLLELVATLRGQVESLPGRGPLSCKPGKTR